MHKEISQLWYQLWVPVIILYTVDLIITDVIELSRVGNCRNITKGNHCWLKLAIFMCKEKRCFFFFCLKQGRARATLRSIILGVNFQKRFIYHAYHTCKYTTCVIFLTVYNFALTTAGQKPLLLGDRCYLSKAQSLLNHLLYYRTLVSSCPKVKEETHSPL